MDKWKDIELEKMKVHIPHFNFTILNELYKLFDVTWIIKVLIIIAENWRLKAAMWSPIPIEPMYSFSYGHLHQW